MLADLKVGVDLTTGEVVLIIVTTEGMKLEIPMAPDNAHDLAQALKDAAYRSGLVARRELGKVVN